MNAVKRVVVVGAGPGGLAAVGRLRQRGGERLEIVLATPGARATFLPGTLDAALGDAEPDQFTARVQIDGVRCVDSTVERVAPDGVQIDGHWLAADAVVAAPGLALSYEAVPEWERVAVAWDPVAAASARERLAGVAAGRVVIAACSLPYRCPPAPFALAIRIAERHFRAGHMTRVIAATPEAMPLAGVGGDAPALVMDACAAAGVQIERGFAVDLPSSEDGALRALDGRELRYDTAFLVPPHIRPGCLSDLPGDGPLVSVGDRGSVDGTTLYVVGDAAATAMPRAAGVARGTAIAAADGLLEALGIAAAPPADAIEASCYLFHWGGAVSRLRVSYDGGEPSVEIDGPSLDLRPAREGERRRFLAAAQGDGATSRMA